MNRSDKMRYSPHIFSIIALVIGYPNLILADSMDSANRFDARKNQIQKELAKQGMLNNSQLNIHESYGRTVVVGTMINRQNIQASGTEANAAGTQLNIGATPNEAGNVTGERIDLKGTSGSVYVRVNTVNQGNISADAAGFNAAEANAAANQINVKGTKGIVSVHANTVSRGNINANASGLSYVEANAAATQINIDDKPNSIHVDGNIVQRGNITAEAKGGVAAVIEAEW
jgi:hypothetical protein